MTELTYSIKEILDLQFRSQEKDFKEIKEMLVKQEQNSEKQFNRLDAEISALKSKIGDLEMQLTTVKTDKGWSKAIFGTAIVFVAAIFSFALNRIF